MSTTTYDVSPHPTYEVPPTLRQAFDEGLDITAIDADTVGILAAGDLEAEEITRQRILFRHYVTAALRGRTEYCVPWGNPDDGYVLQWPSQDMLNGNQWWADLLEEPDLLSAVLERLTEAQCETVALHVANPLTEGGE